MRLTKPAIAVLKLGIVAAGIAQKCNAAAAMLHQVPRGIHATTEIVATDGGTGLPLLCKAPADEMGFLLNQFFQFFAVQFIIAIAEQDDAIGFSAIFIIDMPVGRQLLE